ncbi:MAG: MgtC/SapB family protein [Alphaproteobacteria bacterium]|nr:MgtC/SapB family protein [Alphaproteobacteria bacterium]MBV9979087.1 MgtC/SapB family protein [Bradyrhizobium sp.]
MLVLRLFVAAILGSIVGADRERLVWAAGLRTHMLVCVGACLFMIVSSFGFADILGTSNVVLDPSRVAAQVVSGIGFLGAGSILLRGEVVRGLTTAASLWTVAAIGLAVGGGLYVQAVAATVVILLILAGIKPLEERFQQHHRMHELVLQTEPGQLSISALETAIGYRARRIVRYVARPSEETSGLEEISITLTRLSHKDVEDIERDLGRLAAVKKVIRP